MTRRIFAAICICMVGALAVAGVLFTLFLQADNMGNGFPWLIVGLSAAPVIIIPLLCLGAYRLADAIVKPLHSVDPDLPQSEPPYEELRPLLERITTQQRKLKEQSVELQRKKNEFETATNSMSEGLILLNEKGLILSINRVAVKLLEINAYCIGKPLQTVCDADALRKTVCSAHNGEHAKAVLSLNGQNYQIHASPTMVDSRVAGVTLLIFDITEKEKAEQMRQEFTANVSHELKTPLHTISGCAELLMGGMVRQEDVPRFTQQIYTEAQRMITLVEDIIKLSRLDEGAAEMQKENVDLTALAHATLQSLRPVANEAEITLSLSGDSVPLFGIRQLLSGIVFNLCDNAIKYNRRGGSVHVGIKQTPTEVVLSVRDTGIGIPKENQERIFERFYRVDKSHSKAMGGTGLGLSIVKHAAKLHNATIDLQSAPDHGTTVTIHFPK